MEAFTEHEYIVTDPQIIKSYRKYGLMGPAKAFARQMGAQHVLGQCSIDYSGVMIGDRYYVRIATANESEMTIMCTDYRRYEELQEKLPEAVIVNSNRILRRMLGLRRSIASFVVYIPYDDDEHTIGFLEYVSRKLSDVVSDLEDIKRVRDMRAAF